MQANENLRKDVDVIINQLLKDINPYDSTVKALSDIKLNSGRTILISIGKAAWTMADAVVKTINIDDGTVITKYNHSKGDIQKCKVFEAGHPIVDENSIKATEYALKITENLNENDNVIFCISGGGSALFEKPLIELSKLQDISNQLIKSGASINEINAIRKRLSMVKGGRFASHCLPAHINAIILSDVIGNDLSSIASGPVAVDTYTNKEVLDIIKKYNIVVDEEVLSILKNETIKQIDNVDNYVIGSVSMLCNYTKDICEKLGYTSQIVSDNCTDNVNDIKNIFAELLKESKHNHAYIIGGESVVEVKGNGLGGRNSHLALLCSDLLIDNDNACIFAFGSDGTDGPTDAAGGYVDIDTSKTINVKEYLDNFDSYNGLKKTNGLIISGPTGSNINDVYCLLVK